MTRKSKARYGMSRTYKLNAAVKALRSALFAGVAMAAVAPAAQAACTVVDNTITCTGAFGSTLVFGPGDVALPFDLTTIQLDAGTDIDVNGNYGVNAFSLMDMALTNDGSIDVYSEIGDVVGIFAQSQYGDVAVINNGSISATSNSGDAAGILALSAYGDVSVSTGADSSITAESVSGYANGILAVSLAGDVSVDSAGSITATSVSGRAYGIYAVSQYGTVDVDNSGDITATSTSNRAFGVYAASVYDDVSVNNDGDITAISTSNLAMGIFAYGQNATVTGYGDVTATTTTGSATGIFARASDAYGVITIDVSGDVTAETTAGGNAIGIRAYSYAGDVYVTSAGEITASNGTGNAIGILTGRFGYSTVDNSGNITTSTTTGNSIGIQVDSFYGANITNSGDLQSSTSAGSARGIQALTTFDVAVYNSGDITVSSFSSAGSAQGIRAKSTNGYALIDNSGDISATSTYTNAISILATAYYDVEISNTGNLSAVSDANVYGIYANARFGDTYVYSSGDITASATNLTGTGIYAAAGSSAVIVNAGDINASSVYANSYGAYALALFGAAAINNSGNVSVDAYYDSTGLFAKSLYGVAYINNSGDVSVNSEYGIAAYGLYASAFGNTAVVLNYGGDVSANSYDSDASAIVAVALDDVVIYNSGDLSAYSYNGDAIGIVGAVTDGYVHIYNNHGDITAESVNADGYGIYARSVYGDIVVGSSGDMNIDGDGVAIGIFATTQADISIYNSGEMTVDANNYTAAGIQAFSQDGDIGIYNTGNMTANSYGFAVGVFADANYGSVYVGNSGDLTTSAFGPASGIETHAKYDIEVRNSGDISATSEVSFAAGIVSTTYFGDVYVGNSGNINASSGAYAVGISASTDFGYAEVLNSGDITVDGPNYSVGIRAYAYLDVYVGNGGDITSNAVNGSSTGIEALSYNNVDVLNSGNMSVTSVYGEAIGIYAFSPDGDVYVGSAGDMSIYSEYNAATGIFAAADNGAVYVKNSGDLHVSTGSVYDAYYNVSAAVGIQASGYSGVTVLNSGDLNANAVYVAFGVNAVSNGSVSITNTGSILAAADYSVGIRSESGDSTSISNSGTINATGDAAWAIVTYAEGTTITNAGTGKIFGAIWTSAWYDETDSLTNNGKWYVGDIEGTYFGGGDDSIVNSSTGKIFMDDSYISMGYSEGSSNSFLNNGKLYANNDNVIDMGGSTSVFTNNGSSIHMDDADVNDTLTIIGDFAGTGHIVVNANGTSLLADRLYIEGDVAANAANVIDVKLLSAPSIADMLAGETIEIVHVTGTSAAANFNIGVVTPPFDELYTVESSLIKEINYSGSNDRFSLGFDISGLSTAGVLASSVAPGVQSLWNQGTGTLFQREGTHREFNQNPDGSGKAEYKAAAGAWVRGFTSSGSLSPDASHDNFGAGGSNNFDMDGSGIEFGVGYAFNSQWAAGLLGGTSESTVDPESGGRVDIDADTLGAYVTYTPGNGFYADFSYRAMDFDGYGQGGQTEFGFDGSADGYSLEMGYGYRMSSGLIIEPQFQYSSVDVDLNTISYNTSAFELTDGDSSQFRIGAALRKSYKTAGGNYWTPYGALSWLNEADGSNSYEIGGLLTGDVDTGGGSALLEAGVTGYIGGFGISAGLNWRDGSAYDSVLGGQLSLRYDW